MQKIFERFAPFLLLSSIVLAFFVGVLWQKVRGLEGSGTKTLGQSATNSPSVSSPLAVANLKSYAKDLKLDSKKFDTCLDEGKYAQKVKDDLAYGQNVGVSGTPSFFVNGHLIVGAQPYEVFQKTFDFILNGGDWDKPTADLEAVSAKATQVETGESPQEGSPNAKIVMIEFSDFECPYCSKFYTQTYSEIKKNYVDNGKVQVYFRQFPLTFHQYAQKAAEASLCANEQNKFWEFHNRMFTEMGKS